MSILQSDIVDSIAIDRLTGIVKLTIADHLDWDDEDTHIELLQQKINAYLRFVQSGEFVSEFPKYCGSPVEIAIYGRCLASHSGEEFLKRAGKHVADAGMKLVYEHFPGADVTSQ